MQDQLLVRPRGWFSRFIDILAGDRRVATLELSFLLDQGRAEIEGQAYELQHPSFFARGYTMRRAGAVVATARADGFFFPSYRFEFEGQSYELRRQGFWTSKMLVLRRAESEVLGSLYPDGLLSRRATAALPAELPLTLRVFVIWLTFVAWRQRRRRS